MTVIEKIQIAVILVLSVTLYPWLISQYGEPTDIIVIRTVATTAWNFMCWSFWANHRFKGLEGIATTFGVIAFWAVFGSVWLFPKGNLMLLGCLTLIVVAALIEFGKIFHDDPNR